MTKIKQPEAIKGWAWELYDSGRWMLCSWCVPNRETLIAEGKPSPEARPVCVRLIRNKDYRPSSTPPQPAEAEHE